VDINADGSLTYTPTPGFVGTDVFSYTVDDGQGGTTSTPVTINVIPAANLSLQMQLNTATPRVGQNVIFTIRLSNAGPDAATHVVVKDVLPAGLTFVSANTANGSYNSTTGLWTLASGLASGSSVTLTLTATVATAGVKTNTAEVIAADQFDPNSTPNNHAVNEDDQAGVNIVGQVRTASLSGYVYLDLNNDGIKQCGERGIGGVSVALKNSLGQVVAVTTTDSAGKYCFVNLPAGTYSIVKTSPAGYVDGLNSLGTVNGTRRGTKTTNQFSGIVLGKERLASITASPREFPRTFFVARR